MTLGQQLAYCSLLSSNNATSNCRDDIARFGKTRDKFIQDGKGRRSQEAIEGKWQQLQDRIGTNIKNLPKSYVEREKGAPCREVGYEYSFSPFLDIFSPL